MRYEAVRSRLAGMQSRRSPEILVLLAVLLMALGPWLAVYVRSQASYSKVNGCTATFEQSNR